MDKDLIDRSEKSGQYMTAVWYVEGGLLKMSRSTNNFFKGDFGEAVKMLDEDLKKEIRAGYLDQSIS